MAAARLATRRARVLRSTIWETSAADTRAPGKDQAPSSFTGPAAVKTGGAPKAEVSRPERSRAKLGGDGLAQNLRQSRTAAGEQMAGRGGRRLAPGSRGADRAR